MMNEKQLRNLALKSISAVAIVVIFSASVMTYHSSIKLYADSEPVSGVAVNLEEPELTLQVSGQIKQLQNEYTNVSTGDLVDDIGDHYIVIPKTDKDMKVELEDLYMKRSIQVTIEGLTEKVYTENSLYFSDEIPGKHKVSLNYYYDPEIFLYQAVFCIELNKLYVQKLYEDEENIFIELLDPHQVFEKIIVLDAGHGGNDTGTISTDEKYLEKDINLSVVLYLKELLEQEEQYKVYFTRLDDDKVYLNPRLNLANDVKADLFLSVHCNASEYLSANGSEVLYGTSRKIQGLISSKKFADICLTSITQATNRSERGIIKSNDIYIINNSKVPVALVELGFMTNQEDMAYLSRPENRKQAALGLLQAIEQSFEVMEEADE